MIVLAGMFRLAAAAVLGLVAWLVFDVGGWYGLALVLILAAGLAAVAFGGRRGRRRRGDWDWPESGWPSPAMGRPRDDTEGAA